MLRGIMILHMLISTNSRINVPMWQWGTNETITHRYVNIDTECVSGPHCHTLYRAYCV
jgi:hypothetical protein